ncbi:hypothetical protein [Microbacterium pumilum]|uniref:Uncharacterized protein n=1 Tax=Microbacterium pumilum TaxID=344165 RepID=A0ABP5D806_9MICO
MVPADPPRQVRRAPASYYILAVVFGVIATSIVAAIVGVTNQPDFWLAFGIGALCAAYPAFALGHKLFVSRNTIVVDAHGEQSVEVQWMLRAGAETFLDLLVAMTLGAAVLLITRFELQAAVALLGLLALAVADVGARYLVIRARAS